MYAVTRMWMNWGSLRRMLFLSIFYGIFAEVVLQCCVNFLLYSKVNQWYIYRYPHFLSFLPIWVITEDWAELPVLYRRFPLVVSFICSSLYVSIPIPQFISPHPFSTPQFCPLHPHPPQEHGKRLAWPESCCGDLQGCTYCLMKSLLFSFGSGAPRLWASL